MSHSALSKRARWSCLALVTTFACGGTIDFKDKSAMVIAGQGPEEPKPPPPPEPEPKPEPKPEPPPAPKKKRVTVKEKKIEIDEKIQFAKAEAVILPESNSLLDEIVEVLKENSQIKKVAIEGHTSSEGGAELNKTLSENRAKAVMEYLVAHGIEAKRLESKGYGSEKPIAANDTEDNREKNRRVEFNIIKQTAKKSK